VRGPARSTCKPQRRRGWREIQEKGSPLHPLFYLQKNKGLPEKEATLFVAKLHCELGFDSESRKNPEQRHRDQDENDFTKSFHICPPVLRQV
jgi:hypothetical protein